MSIYGNTVTKIIRIFAPRGGKPCLIHPVSSAVMKYIGFPLMGMTSLTKI